MSRAFGDIEAKVESLGGKPGVVSAVPEITKIQITQDLDFIALGSDGIFDRLSDQELVDEAWSVVKEKMKEKTDDSSNQIFCEHAVNAIISKSLKKKTQDNVSTVLVSFRNFDEIKLQNSREEEVHQRLQRVLKMTLG